MVRKSYTEKQFKKDLTKLNKLINSFNQSGGSSCGAKGAESVEEDFTLLQGGSNCHCAHEEDFTLLYGGALPDRRSFTVVEMNGEKIRDGGAYYISRVKTRGSNKGAVRKNPPTPADAARKAVTQMCNNMKMKNKTKCKVTITLRETTRGSTKKLYGPYVGTMHKVDMKKKKTTVNGKKIGFGFRPHVKLAQKK